MKRIVLMLAVVGSLLIGKLSAQTGLPGYYRAKTVPPMQLAISADMTTNLIFPYAIKSVDRGTGDILAQKARGAENVLQVKAAKEAFKESNLSVITADGQLFSFLLSYSQHPSHLNLSFYTDSTNPVQLSGTGITADVIEQTAQKVFAQQKFLHRKTRDQYMKLALGSIFYHQAYLWFCLDIMNRSLVDYEVQYIKFLIKDRKQAKRTAVQVKELDPAFISSLPVITSDVPGRVVIGIPAFTLSKKQELTILLKEKNGGRDLELTVRNGVLLRARLL